MMRIKSRYDGKMNSEMKYRIMSVLNESREAMPISRIQTSDLYLVTSTTPQKIGQLLNQLVEDGKVKKTKSSSLGKMVYKSTTIMAEEGYEV